MSHARHMCFWVSKMRAKTVSISSWFCKKTVILQTMNRLSFHIVFLMMLLWLTAGCGGPSHDDLRLLAADKMLGQTPDSALNLLNAIDVNSLKTESDRAYHALLLTQARYRCYEVATSDSLIDVALSYYRSHPGDGERLTRALIYKGAVMEELGQPQAAMTCYKEAQATVMPDDYFNQGYLRLRMGQIYNDYYVPDSIDVTLFQEARRYFELIPDSFYIMATLLQTGCAYIKTNPDSVLPYLYQAASVAETLHEKGIGYKALRYIASMKMYSSTEADLTEAKAIALSILDDPNRNRDDDEHLLMVAAYTLAKQGKSDSAYYYIGQVPSNSLTPEAQVFYDKCMAEAAISKGDIKQYQYYYEAADNLSDSLTCSDLLLRLRDVDAKYDNEVLKNENLRKSTTVALVALGGLALAGILGLIILLLSRNASRRKRQLRESEDNIEHLRDDCTRLESQLQSNQAMNDSLKQTIRNQIETFSHLVEKHKILYTSHPEKFSEVFMKSYNAKQPDGSFWSSIQAYADSISNGMVNNAVSQHPTMSDSDVRFLSLYICDLPTTVIMICMGYGNLRSTYNKKRRVADLLGCSGNLEDAIMDWKRNHGCKV